MKTLKIAFQDFKRLIFNPITLISLAISAVIFISMGFFFKPVIVEGVSLSYQSAASTTELYKNFTASATVEDSKANLDALISENSRILAAHRSTTLAEEYEDLQVNINKLLGRIDLSQSSSSRIPQSTFNVDVNTVNKLGQFIEEIKNYPMYEMNFYISNADFKIAEDLYAGLSAEFYTRTDYMQAYKNCLKYVDLCKRFDSTQGQTLLNAPAMNRLQTLYVTNVQTKLDNILSKINELNSQPQSASALKDMTSLILNYKYQTKMANDGLKAELHLILADALRNYGNIYNFTKQNSSEAENTTILAKYVLAEESLYYADYQTAMSFNRVTGKISAYDVTYTLMCIVGLITICIGIYFAYRLYGEDRVNGKMDMVLTQNVSFNNVFTGKFIAILLSTLLLLVVFFALFLGSGFMMYGGTFSNILAVYNLSSAYKINPIAYLLLKLACVELEVLFYVILTIFLMNITRHFKIMLIVGYSVALIAFLCNMFLSGIFVYTLLPFVHTNLFSFFGGATSSIGFLNTMFIANGNIYISMLYYLIITVAFYNFTKQLFRRN